MSDDSQPSVPSQMERATKGLGRREIVYHGLAVLSLISLLLQILPSLRTTRHIFEAASMMSLDTMQPSPLEMDQPTTQQEEQRERWIGGPDPIFYNAYVPLRAIKSTERRIHMTDTDSALGIIQEQLLQRATIEPNSTLYYNLITADSNETIPIGDRLHNSTTVAPLVKRVFDTWCGIDKCHMDHHYSQGGNESLTLQSLWEYCQDPSRGNELVTYFHDKGSHHRTRANQGARRIGTKGAMECRAAMRKNPDSCNICSAQFAVLPQYLGFSKYVDQSVVWFDICLVLLSSNVVCISFFRVSWFWTWHTLLRVFHFILARIMLSFRTARMSR